MALSNWDTLMVDQNGKPIDGMWTSPAGVGIEVYKNWVHVHDQKAYIGGGYAYTEPIVMRITEGDIQYRDVSIVALRGPQNGIYICAWNTIYSDDYKSSHDIGCIGIGVYGFADNGKYLGVNKGSTKWYMKEINKQETRIDTMFSYEYDKNGKLKKLRESYKYKHDVYDIPDIFKKMDLLKAERYNQGDGYFAAHIDVPLQNTKPGEAKPTIMSQMMKKG